MATAMFMLVVALMFFGGIARAGVVFDLDEYNFVPGIPSTLKWTGARGPVTISVMSGPDSNLLPVLVIDCEYGRWFQARHCLPRAWRSTAC